MITEVGYVIMSVTERSARCSDYQPQADKRIRHVHLGNIRAEVF